MESNLDIHPICLDIFARISSSVSHELKNTLSIINESAGLLDDLAAMADHGGGVPADRVQVAASAIMRQVSRSNTIIKNFNRFAHSGDSALTRANLEDALSLATDLTSRQAAMKNTTVTVECPSDLEVHTSLLVFEALLYLTLCHLYNSVSGGASITVTATKTLPHIVICFETSDRDGFSKKQYPNEEERILANQIQGKCESGSNTVCITLPAAM